MADAEKNLPATDRRIEKYREQGRIATSREMLAAVSLGAGLLAIFYLLPDIGTGIWQMFAFTRIQIIRDHFTTTEFLWMVSLAIWRVGMPVIGILAISTLLTFVAGLLITGFNFTLDVLAPKWERFDVFSSFEQIFLSATPWVSLLKGLLISMLLVWAVWSTIEDKMTSILLLGSRTMDGQMQFLKALSISALQHMVPVAIGIGVLDLLYQRWHMEQQMMMSIQEVKEEYKDAEGDPHVKSKRKARQRQISMGQALAKVAQADVVVTNPTHYAVALRYRREENAAPVIVARGIDHVALKIRQEAMRQDILTVENRPLARALFAKGAVGAPIPSDLYAPVAEVIALVYKRRRKTISRAR